MGLFNIRSIVEKSASVNDLICTENLHILFLTETWLKSDGNVILAPACPPNYSFIHSVREGKRGGGLANIFSDVLKFNSLSLGSFSSFEYQANILDNKSPVLMVTVYRPPKCSKALFLTEISELLSICATNHNRTLITGDVNLHMDNASCTVAMGFMDLLHSFGFIQHVVGPTHKLGHTLDLVISRGLTITVDKIIDRPELSDHFVLCFNMTVSDVNNDNPEHTVKKRFLTQSAANDFPLYLANANPQPDASSVNDLVHHFNVKIESALNIVAPYKIKKKGNSAATPWINEHTRSLKRDCRRAERVWRKSKLTVHIEILKKKTAAYEKARRLARREYFAKIINDNKTNARVLFSTIEHVLNPPQLYKQSLPASKAKCNEFASFFDNKISNIRADIMSAAASINTLSVNTRCRNVDPSRGSLKFFCAVNEEELRKIISQMTSSSCSLDVIPTPFLKEVLDSVISDILKIVNCSLHSGVFPDSLKRAVVRPLLKKPNLDSSELSNYRPISNLPFLGKILEKVVFKQLEVFLQNNNTHNKFQSGFRKGHSTETALLKVINDLRVASDKKNVSVLLLLDLTAAFDTIEHDILLHRLEHWVGLSAVALSWFRSYLKGRSYSVCLADFHSNKRDICSGVPQGSILGPLLFSLYILPLGELIADHGVNFHFYADDTQIYLSVAPDDPSALNCLLTCLTSIKCWMTDNFFKLNEDKTEILTIGGSIEQRESIRSRLGNLSVESNNPVKNLGVFIDSELNFNAHINHVTKTAFFHLRNIARIRAFLSLDNAKTLIHAFVFSRLDYCNALLSGLPKKTTDRLQLVQNAAARVLTRTKMREHITPVLASLHWLPVVFRIDFKILLLVYKALNGLAPSYLVDCLPRYAPNRPLRSSSADLLDIPKMAYKKHGKAAFCFYGPTAWNKLPAHIRQANSVASFKTQLKTHFFTLAFN